MTKTKIAAFSLLTALGVFVCAAVLGAAYNALSLRHYRSIAGVPGKLQLAFETIVGGVEDQVESSMGDSGRAIVPL